MPLLAGYGCARNARLYMLATIATVLWLSTHCRNRRQILAAACSLYVLLDPWAVLVAGILALFRCSGIDFLCDGAPFAPSALVSNYGRSMGHEHRTDSASVGNGSSSFTGVARRKCFCHSVGQLLGGAAHPAGHCNFPSIGCCGWRIRPWGGAATCWSG